MQAGISATSEMRLTSATSVSSRGRQVPIRSSLANGKVARVREVVQGCVASGGRVVRGLSFSGPYHCPFTDNSRDMSPDSSSH